MLELKNFMPINFLKKEKFTGSHNGMRFRMEKLDLEGEDVYKRQGLSGPPLWHHHAGEGRVHAGQREPHCR